MNSDPCKFSTHYSLKESHRCHLRWQTIPPVVLSLGGIDVLHMTHSTFFLVSFLKSRTRRRTGFYCTSKRTIWATKPLHPDEFFIIHCAVLFQNEHGNSLGTEAPTVISACENNGSLVSCVQSWSLRVCLQWN